MPFQSEAQRRLMYAAAAGKETKADISQKEAKQLVSHDEPGKLPERVEKIGNIKIKEPKKRLATKDDHGLGHIEQSDLLSDNKSHVWDVWVGGLFPKIAGRIELDLADKKNPNVYMSSFDDEYQYLQEAAHKHLRSQYNNLKFNLEDDDRTLDADYYSADEPIQLSEKVEKGGEGDGSDMAKQFLSEINELSAKINSMVDGKQELEDWVDGKITRAKTDLSDISGYLKNNQNVLRKAKECCEMLSKKKQQAEKSIHGSRNTPDRIANTVDGIAKTDDQMSDYEKKAKGALDFRNQMKDFRRQHGSTIMDIGAGRRIPADRADAYHAARGQLVIGHGVGPQDIPPRIPGNLIDRPQKVQAQEIKPLALPAAKSMEALVDPKSLLAKVENCIKCMRKSSGQSLEKEFNKSEEELEKSSKKKKPFHGYNKKKHARSGGLNDSYRKKINRETGSNLKRPVTKKNVKPGSKAAKRRKSFCARMKGVKGPTSKKGKLTPKGAALKRWRCSKSLNKSESVPLELRADLVLKSLRALIKGDVIDFASKKKQTNTETQSTKTPASNKMSFEQIAEQNRANQQRMQRDRAARNEQTKRMYNIEPSTEALTSSPPEEKFYDAGTGKERSLSKKPKRLGEDLFGDHPQSYIKNLINDYGIDGLGLTGAYEDAAMELHNEIIEDEGLEYNDDEDEWLDSNGEVVDPDEYFPEEEEIMERMFDNHRHLMRDEEDSEEVEYTSKSFDKSNSVKPFGENIYDEEANIGRKMKRTGAVIEGAGPNQAVQQRGNSLHGTMKDQTKREAAALDGLNREQPVKSFDINSIPVDKRAEVSMALLSGKSHPLIESATKVLVAKKKGNRIVREEEDTDKSLEKKLSLKGVLTAGALGASAIAGGAQASPESDLHSQLSNLNVMGEYHTPKTGSKSVLKEPSQLKADPSHPTASYSRESTGGGSTGNFYGPDAEKAKALLQNYDTTTKSFKKSNKLKGGKGDKSRRSDFSAKQLADGKKVELEHAKDSKIAEEIALDHLAEDPRYYSKLKTSGLADELEKRCWEGYKPVPGKKAYSKGSCVKKAISAPAIESGEYKGEKLDAHHHNRLGKEYREMARQAISKNDKQSAAKYHVKSLFHFSKATEMGYEPMEEENA